MPSFAGVSGIGLRAQPIANVVRGGVVESVHAGHVVALDRRGADRGFRDPRHRRRLRRPVAVVVLGELLQNLIEVPGSGDQEVIEAFAAAKPLIDRVIDTVLAPGSSSDAGAQFESTPPILEGKAKVNEVGSGAVTARGVLRGPDAAAGRGRGWEGVVQGAAEQLVEAGLEGPVSGQVQDLAVRGVRDAGRSRNQLGAQVGGPGPALAAAGEDAGGAGELVGNRGTGPGASGNVRGAGVRDRLCFGCRGRLAGGRGGFGGDDADAAFGE